MLHITLLIRTREGLEAGVANRSAYASMPFLPECTVAQCFTGFLGARCGSKLMESKPMDMGGHEVLSTTGRPTHKTSPPNSPYALSSDVDLKESCGPTRRSSIQGGRSVCPGVTDWGRATRPPGTLFWILCDRVINKT